MSRQPSDWYNAMGWHGSGSMAPSSATDALVGDRSLDISLKQNAYMAVNHSLYCFPNPTASERDSRAPDWCVRRTRLILETELDGVTGYYQATIPTPERNAHYVVHCTLRKPGSTHPEQEGPDTMDVRIAVAEEDWDHDYAVTENA